MTNKSLAYCMVRTWGETLTIKDTAEILNRCPNNVRKLIKDGCFRTDPTGRVIVRSLAEWIASSDSVKQMYHV